MIDWSRMAEPQADQYDTGAVLALRKPQPLRSSVSAGALIFDGQVTVCHPPAPVPIPAHYVNAAVEHENIARAAAYVRCWPAAYEQFKALIDTVHPLTDKTIPAAERAVYLGSISHSVEEQPRVIYASVDSALGLAQAMVHEMAHHKLRALGVSIEHTRRLLTNDPGELFNSPIRKDKKRPMSAVFHAVYSFIYVTCLDLHMYASETDAETRERVLLLLARNVPRMEAGLEEIKKHIRTDAEGEIFVSAFLSWADAVIRSGNEILDRNGYGMPVLA